MSVNTQLFVSSDWSFFEIRKALESVVGPLEVHISKSVPELIQLTDRDTFGVNVFMGHRHNGFTGVLIDAYMNDENIRIFRKLHDQMGGFLRENDCNDDYVGQGFDPDNNALWLIRYHASQNALSKDDLKEIGQKIEELASKNKKS
jgi:hypothetical protein